MTAINYYPLFNSGQTIARAGQQDKRRVYGLPDLYFTRDLYVISDFDTHDRSNTWRLNPDLVLFDSGNYTWDGEFILFQIDTLIDYAVITSLN